MVEGQGPEGRESLARVDCVAAFGVEAVEVTDWLLVRDAVSVGPAARCKPGLGGPAGWVADMAPDVQDGRRRTLVWNDGMLFHSAELMAD